MKTLILLSFIILSLISCKKEKSIEEEFREIEALELAVKNTDSIIKSSAKTSALDTSGIHTSPVKIIKSKLVNVEYTNKKNIQLTYKNISQKDIKAIKFLWYGENAFLEPAEMGSYSNNGIGSGFTDDLLKSNKKTTSTWDIYSGDAHKILIAKPIEVVFTDDTKWKLNQ